MLTIRFIRWIYGTLNGVERPWQIALGLALGLAFGMSPIGALTLLGLLLMLFINCHFGSGIFGMILGFALFQPLLRFALFWYIGDWALMNGPHDFFNAMAASDVWRLFWLHDRFTLGGLICGIGFGIAAFFGAWFVVRKFRESFHKRVGNSRIVKALASTWLFRGLRWLFIG